MSTPTRNRTEHQLDLTILEAVYRDAVAESPHLHARYRTALTHLQAQQGQVIFLGSALLVQSRSTPETYAVNGACQCAFHLNRATDRMCPHRCAYDLAQRTLERMAKAAPPVAPVAQPSYLSTVALLAALGPELSELSPKELDTALGHLRTVAQQINAEYLRRGRAKPGMPAPAKPRRAKK